MQNTYNDNAPPDKDRSQHFEKPFCTYLYHMWELRRQRVQWAQSEKAPRISRCPFFQPWWHPQTETPVVQGRTRSVCESERDIWAPSIGSTRDNEKRLQFTLLCLPPASGAQRCQLQPQFEDRQIHTEECSAGTQGVCDLSLQWSLLGNLHRRRWFLTWSQWHCVELNVVF